MIETRHLKNVVIFDQTILRFVLSRKFIRFVILAKFYNSFIKHIQKQPPRGVCRKRCYENMQQIYRRTPKLFKKDRVKRPKAVPPERKFGPNVILCNSFLGNITSGIQFGLHLPVDIIRVFFVIPDFLAEILKASKNQRKTSYILQHSLAQKTSLIVRTSTHLTLKIIFCQNTGKNLSYFINFPANNFLFGIRKNICTALLLETEELHS